MNSQSNSAALARYTVDDYNFQFGTYHSARSRDVCYFWAVPELEIWTDAGSLLGNLSPSLLRARLLATRKLAQLERDGKHHPRPHRERHPSLWKGDETIGVGQAAAVLKVTTQTVRNMIVRGELVAISQRRVNGRRKNFRITLDSLLAYRTHNKPEIAPQQSMQRQTRGQISAASKELGIHRTTLWRRRQRGTTVLLDK